MTLQRWPVTLSHGDVSLRPLKQGDARAWREVRRANVEWLQPWEATLPPEARTQGDVVPTFGGMVRRLRKDARAGRILPFALAFQGHLVGQVTVGGITWGSLRAAYIGYWIDHRVAGLGIMPTGVAMALDHAFDVLHLHRIEINIRPENAPSLRVVEKLGLRRESERSAYLHIDGDWRDHICFVAYPGDAPDGYLARVSAAHRDARDTPNT